MSKKTTTRKCVICGKKFTPKTANASVCSDKCRKALKAKRDKARKAAKKVAKTAPKKPVVKAVKGKAVEKITLPKKPVVTKVAKPTTIVTVKSGGDPYKVLFLASIIRDRAMREIVKRGGLNVSRTAKK